MTRAVDLLSPIGIPDAVRSKLGDRDAPEAWSGLDDGRWMLLVATRLGLERATVAQVLAGVADSEDLRRWRDGDSGDQATRDAARALRRRAALVGSGEERRRLYAQRAALCAVLMPAGPASGYAHAAIAYAGADPADVAGAVRAEVAWSRVQALIDAGGMPTPPEDAPHDVRRDR